MTLFSKILLPSALVLSLACSQTPQPEPPPCEPSSDDSSDEEVEWAESEGWEAVPSAISHADLIIPVSEADPQWGNQDAPVTIVEFVDFECPFSGRVQATLGALVDEYGPEKLRVVFKSHPLPFHKNAPAAHDAAMAVHEIAGPRAFDRYQKLVWENRSALTRENFGLWAEKVGVPEAELWQVVESGRPTAKVNEDKDLAKTLGATGTPAFFINGSIVSGAQPIEKFRAVIDTELRAAQELLSSGTDAMQVYAVRVQENYEKPRAREPAEVKKAEPDLTVWKIPVNKTDPVRGPRDALVTVVIIADFQCPFCKRVQPTLDQVRSLYENDVRIVWKDNPLGFHPKAKPAAEVARFILKKKGNDAFWKAHDQLFESQPKLDDEVYKQISKDAGLSFSWFQSSNKDKIREEIGESMELAADFQARGTPHFFINGRRLKGAQPFEEFKKLIDEQLSIARALEQKGTPRSKIYETLLKDAKSPPPQPTKKVSAPLADTPYLGKKSAKIVVQEFGDMECPFTRRAVGIVEEFLKRHPGEVVFYYRHHPLPFHKHAPLAAQAAHEVFVQKGNDAYWKFFNEVMKGTTYSREESVKRLALEAIAQKLGVNMVAFRAALDSGKHEARISADVEAAKAASITGTPGFVVGDVFVSGAQPIEVFERALKQAKKSKSK